MTHPLFAQRIIKDMPCLFQNSTHTEITENNGGIREIASVKQIAQLTGEPSLNNTGYVNVYGTDLGSMFLHSDGKIYFLFGDTFGAPGTPGSGDWRSNTIAYTTDSVASNGIVFDGWITDPSGNARALIEGNHDPNNGSGEVTKIPTAGWSFGNRQFMWFMSVKQWGIPGRWEVNYSEIAYSDDNGNTWHRSGTQRSGNSNFIQVAIAEQSGYLLIWGIPSGRFGGVKLARVLPSDVLDNAAYQYYTGTSWSTNEADAVLIVDSPVGELSVLWNPYLQRWIMMYLNESTACIEVREAPEPVGPWSDPWKVVCANNYPALYGAFMHNKYIKNNGETVYFLMSQFGPYNVFLMEVVFNRYETEVIEKPFVTEIPQSFVLYQNYPNPFNHTTAIKYHLHKATKVVLKIYDLLGQEINTMVNDNEIAGEKLVVWDSKNLNGQFVNSGIYFCRLQVGDEVQVQKMSLLK